MARKSGVFTRRMKGKLFIAFAIVLFFFGIVMVRLTFINFKDGAKYEKQVLAQQNYTTKTLSYARGEIEDRNGTPLATSVKVYNLIIEPKNILDADTQRNKGLSSGQEKNVYQKTTVQTLAQFFDVEEDELNEIIENNKNSYYQKVLKRLEYDQVKEFQDYLEKELKITDSEGKEQTITYSDRIKGVYFEEEYRRSYPNNELASNVIGFSNSGNVGSWGLEQQYNSILNGINGREYGYINDNTQLERTTQPAQNGHNLITTLDINIQRIAEKHIQKFMKKIGADKGVNVLIMDPNNGEVLAMATDSTYDLNNPRDDEVLERRYSKKEIAAMDEEEKLTAFNQVWRNELISKIFEPGSTFKPFTIATGLEENKLKGNETYYCKGYLQKDGWSSMIKCHNYYKGGCGLLTLSEALQESCNVALMKINDLNGAELFTEYERYFGFGRKTGIDLPGEETGLLINADKMGTADLATNSFGQNINVTMIQLASAFASLINGGHYYQPHLVKQIVDENGSIIKDVDKVLVKDTVSKETSEWIKESLYQTVEKGTGKDAKIEGYTVGGKTGTAEKQPRSDNTYLVSFISFVPVEKPEVLIYVTIDELDLKPQDQSGYAVRLSRDIMKEIVTYMNIPQTKTTTTSSKSSSSTSTTQKNNSDE